MHRIAALALPALAAACLDPEAARQVDDARLVCDPDRADAWAERVDDCRERRADDCAGVLALGGELRGIDIAIEAELAAATVDTVSFDGGEAELDRLSLAGPSSQLRFVLEAHAIGGSLDAMSAPPRELVWGAGDDQAEPTADRMTDGRVGGELRIETATTTVELPALEESGSLVLTRQTDAEIAGELAASFGDDDSYVRGCFPRVPGRAKDTTFVIARASVLAIESDSLGVDVKEAVAS